MNDPLDPLEREHHRRQALTIVNVLTEELEKAATSAATAQDPDLARAIRAVNKAAFAAAEKHLTDHPQPC